MNWCPNNTTINIKNNKNLLQPIPSNIRKRIKTDNSSIISEINTLSTQKHIILRKSSPTANPKPKKEITWCNPPSTSQENPSINGSLLGSCNDWCKKIFNIIKSYIICESTSVVKTFKNTHNVFGLEVLNKSNKILKKHKNNTYSELIAFRIKILSGTLPTREKLHEIRPDHYPSESCPRCPYYKEDIRHTFECPEAEDSAIIIIRIINEILQSTNNSYPIQNIWQVVEIACGITHNIFSPVDMEHWSNASNTALSLLYDSIWKPRCNTANTSLSTGIKWVDKPMAKITKNSNPSLSIPTIQNPNSNSLSFNSSTSDKLEPIELTSLTTDSYIKNKFSYKNCISDLLHSNINFNSVISG